jgi:hypothetical protein
VDRDKEKAEQREAKRNPSENRSQNINLLWYIVRYQSTYEQRKKSNVQWKQSLLGQKSLAALKDFLIA